MLNLFLYISSKINKIDKTKKFSFFNLCFMILTILIIDLIISTSSTEGAGWIAIIMILINIPIIIFLSIINLITYLINIKKSINKEIDITIDNQDSDTEVINCNVTTIKNENNVYCDNQRGKDFKLVDCSYVLSAYLIIFSIILFNNDYSSIFIEEVTLFLSGTFVFLYLVCNLIKSKNSTGKYNWKIIVFLVLITIIWIILSLIENDFLFLFGIVLAIIISSFYKIYVERKKTVYPGFILISLGILLLILAYVTGSNNSDEGSVAFYGLLACVSIIIVGIGISSLIFSSVISTIKLNNIKKSRKFKYFVLGISILLFIISLFKFYYQM